MKAEKIEKHMLRRTVIVAHDGAVKGVINTADGSAAPALIAGVSRLSALHGGLYNGWFAPEEIRKATDTECVEFFEWVYNDGRDVADGFKRFGGMPRGFEAWRMEKRKARGSDDPWDEQDPACIPFQPHEEPEPVVAPQHKMGDLRVALDYDGLGIVGRVRKIDLDGDVWIGGACCRPAARPLFDPTPESVSRLVTQQRERGIVPELGDLVFVALPALATAIVAHNLSTAPDAKMLQGVMCGGGAISWALAPTIAAHTLVIRRSPFREVADE